MDWQTIFQYLMQNPIMRQGFVNPGMMNFGMPANVGSMPMQSGPLSFGSGSPWLPQAGGSLPQWPTVGGGNSTPSFPSSFTGVGTPWHSQPDATQGGGNLPWGQQSSPWLSQFNPGAAAAPNPNAGVSFGGSNFGNLGSSSFNIPMSGVAGGVNLAGTRL